MSDARYDFVIVGGGAALQAASIIIGLPLAGVTLLVGAGLIKALLAGEL